MMSKQGALTTGIALVLMAVTWLFNSTASAFPNRVVATLTVGKGPSRIALDGSDKFAYVTNRTDGTVSRINVYTFQAKPEALKVGTDPIGVIVRTDNARVYVANSLDNTISVVDPTNFSVTSSFATAGFPQGLAVKPSGGVLYVATRNDGLVRAYNSLDNSLQLTLDLGDGVDPFSLAVTPDGLHVLVVSRGLGVVTVLKATDFSVEGSVAVGAGPQGIAVDPNGKFAYVANTLSDSVSKIDIANFTLINSVNVGGDPSGIVVASDNDFAYVTQRSDNSVGVIRISDFSVGSTGITVGRNPQGLALTSDGRYLLVVNEDDGTVNVLTDAPHVSIRSTEPSAINDSDNPTSTITWRSDRSGPYQVEVGGDGVKGSGEIIDSGTAQADQDRQVAVTASELTQGDGAYFVFVYVDETATSTTGRIASEVILDTVAPSIPANLRVALGDELLIFQWNAGTDTGSGIGGYRLSYGTESGRLDQSVDTGNVLRYELTGLVNGATYFATVSALDKATNESGPSNEVSETPEIIVGAIPSGGGCFIDTASSVRPCWWPVVPAGLIALLIGLCVRAGKGRIGLWVLLMLCSWNVQVHAEDYRNVTGIMLGLKAGYFLPMDGMVEETYDQGGFAGGVTITWINRSNFETTVGVGLKALNAEALTSSGRRTGQDSTLLIVPVEFTIRYRFEYVEDQLFIPYIDAGVQGDYYNEEIKDLGEESGFTAGYHGSLGVRMSLNAIAPDDSDGFYQITGVKETFLVMQGRYEVIDRFGQEDFDLGGLILTMGVELQF
ncbi:MAG: beta-propeller fold lactonase family protein [Deltaproteobacteria bacterium]|nr:beta-propeller fold lactonase family protein [Deltaproteobacteria bacterium]